MKVAASRVLLLVAFAHAAAADPAAPPAAAPAAAPAAPPATDDGPVCESPGSALAGWLALASWPHKASMAELALSTAFAGAQDVVVFGVSTCGITRLDDTHVAIPLALLDRIAHRNLAAFRVRVVPAYQNGEVLGYRLYAVRPRSLTSALGLRNADTLLTANGIPLNGALAVETLLDALARHPPTIELVIDNHGKRRTMIYRIR